MSTDITSGRAHEEDIDFQTEGCKISHRVSRSSKFLENIHFTLFSVCRRRLTNVYLVIVLLEIMGVRAPSDLRVAGGDDLLA